MVGCRYRQVGTKAWLQFNSILCSLCENSGFIHVLHYVVWY